MHVRQGTPRSGPRQHELFGAGSLIGADQTAGSDYSATAAGCAASGTEPLDVVGFFYRGLLVSCSLKHMVLINHAVGLIGIVFALLASVGWLSLFST